MIDEALTVGAQYITNGDYTFNYTLPIGKQLNVDAGNKVTLFVYNGDTSGSITFTLAFRAAKYL